MDSLVVKKYTRVVFAPLIKLASELSIYTRCYIFKSNLSLYDLYRVLIIINSFVLISFSITILYSIIDQYGYLKYNEILNTFLYWMHVSVISPEQAFCLNPAHTSMIETSEIYTKEKIRFK